MKPRKSKVITSALTKKGFKLEDAKHHHQFYYLHKNGKRQAVYTYISHGNKEYGDTLLGMMKKQLGFDNNTDFENFLDCPFTHEDYIAMLKKKGIVE